MYKLHRPMHSANALGKDLQRASMPRRPTVEYPSRLQAAPARGWIFRLRAVALPAANLVALRVLFRHGAVQRCVGG